jgi:hypothetical protein
MSVSSGIVRGIPCRMLLRATSHRELRVDVFWKQDNDIFEEFLTLDICVTVPSRWKSSNACWSRLDLLSLHPHFQCTQVCS